MFPSVSSTDLGSAVLGSASLNHLRLDRRTAGYWRATFDHPAINTVTSTSTAIEEFDVGAGLVPSGGPTARLPRLVNWHGRRRADAVARGAADHHGTHRRSTRRST
jgi:hypothetical protein